MRGVQLWYSWAEMSTPGFTDMENAWVVSTLSTPSSSYALKLR